jgi:glycosyltransferase involved in cell wall biosynthesis
LRNCFQVLRRFQREAVTPVLFAAPTIAREDLEAFGRVLDEPVRSATWLGHGNRAQRTGRALTTGVDPEAARAFKQAGIDVVFEASEFFGWRFPFPVVTWIADFQSHHLPQLFPWRARWRTYLGRHLQLFGHRTILLSSESARRDYERFYPRGTGRSVVVSFAIAPEQFTDPPDDLAQRYDLPARFVFLPNQFWRHKNHSVIVEALPQVLASVPDCVVVACGSPADHRNPGHFDALTKRINDLGMGQHFRSLGMIPREDLLGLMQTCVALLNPSFFEGWSTTVEEAKALGVPLVLSNLDVHREQAGSEAIYFDPESPSAASEALIRAWSLPTPGPTRRLDALEAATGRAQHYADRMQAALAHAFANYRDPRGHG